MKRGAITSLFNGIPTRLTKAGWWYLGATILTSAAAYHSASNVLFLALAFLMSALLLNGLISWWNFSKLTFRNLKASRLYANKPGIIQFDIIDKKKALSSQGLTAVIEILYENQHQPEQIKTFIHSSPQNPHKKTTLVSVNWTAQNRGWHTIHLKQIESYFPFGLLLKIFHQQLKKEVLVWPAIGETHSLQPFGSSNQKTAATSPIYTMRSSGSNEIAGLRNYERGDPIQMFHWKKTAQQRRPIVIEQHPTISETPELLRFDFHESYFANETEIHHYCSSIATWLVSQKKAKKTVRIALHQRPDILVHNDSGFVRVMDQLATIAPQPTKLAPEFTAITPEALKPFPNEDA